MQKIIYVYDYNTGEVDGLLEEGWKIISVNPVPIAQGKAYSIAAYVVLEKSETNSNKQYTTINELASINREVALKQFYDPEVIV